MAIARFGLSDLPEYGNWLVSRLRERWPAVSDIGWASRLRAWIAMNDAQFLRCGGCVALALARMDDMDGSTIVEERFTFSREPVPEPMGSRGEMRKKSDPNTPAEEAMIALYRHVHAWAISLRARAFVLGTHADLVRSRLEPVFGEALSRERQAVVRIG